MAGKSISMQHRLGNPEEEKLGPTISIDYALKSAEEEEQDIMPTLVAYDNTNSSMWAIQVESKGVDAMVGVTWLVNKLDASGYKEMKITFNVSLFA